MDDHEIVDLYWQRDEHAIEATAAKYESYCMKISQNILSDRADSEENVNDTYLHAWQAMPPQRPAILSAFLGKIARNLALNRYKARSAQKRQGDVFALSLDELTTRPRQQSSAAASARFCARRAKRCAACSSCAISTANRSKRWPRVFTAARAASKPRSCARAESSRSISSRRDTVKHEVLTRAIGELDDELIADAYAYKPRKRYALPRFLAAAACLVLVLAAALAMTRDTLPAEIKVEGAALSSIPIPISQPAAMALDARGSLSDPLSPMLTIESKSGEAVTVTVSDGVLTQPLYSLQEEFTSYTVSGKVQLCWTIEEPDTGTVYTLSLDGAPAVTLRYDEANGYWAAARA